MPWTFDISAGKILDPSGAFVSSAYAGGNKGQNPEGVDNPADEPLKNIGPLPEGLYTFGEPVAHSQLGPFAIPLTPDSANVMYGRGGFYCHGDTAALDHAASEGCIIAPRTTREAMWAAIDHQILVKSSAL